MSNSSKQTDFQHWQRETDATGVVHLYIDKHEASANVLSAGVLTELNELLTAIATERPKGVVVRSAKRGMFVMGADINEFTTLTDADSAYTLIRSGQQVIDRVAELPCPTVALIEGHALGGGLELAMACDYRVTIAGDKGIIGLPEVQLGIHPGFGGTVRAVQLAGAREALQLMLTGRSLKPAHALRLGLVDRVAADSAAAVSEALTLIQQRPARRRAPLLDRLLNWSPLRPLVAGQVEKQVARKARKEHYPAPYAIIDLWRRYGAAGERAFEAEAHSIAELMVTPTARNLVRVFFLQNNLKRQGGKEAPPIKAVHVVGAGVMGGDIATWCAYRGLDVTLQDREQQYIDPAIERARQFFTKRLKQADKVDAAMQRLQSDVEGNGAARADLIIEAIYENQEAKQALYRTLEPKMKSGAILATNTSSIRLEALAVGLRAPDRLIGIHFFNPVALLPLVEIVRAPNTEASALAVGHGFVKRIGKTPLEASSTPGFLVNRILAPYMGEALFLAREGVALRTIDDAAVAFGMPVGPVELADTVGLDVALHVSRILAGAYGSPVAEELVQKVDAGELGRKNGQGFYKWVDGKAQKPAADNAPVPDELTDRLILVMVNEAVACLADGVVADEDSLDAGVIFGTGFAPFRGGPINYARTRGLNEVRSRLEWLAGIHGERFEPHPGWDRLIADSTTNQPFIVEK
ncbi:MAG: 3-hydroxyacyl-CoA dehydrogenase NAD-binding domain-containing protein [Pseudomonadota bacterium]